MKEAREDVHTVDEDKVMKRASVGDDDSTHLACDLAKSVQVGGELLVFGNGTGSERSFSTSLRVEPEQQQINFAPQP